MSGEILLVGMRLVHLLAAAAWVGGSIAYAVTGRPAPGGRRSFSWLVGLCSWALFISGVALTVDRLTAVQTSPLYVGLLAAKVGLAVAMVLAAGALVPSTVARLRARLEPPGQRPPPGWLSRPYLVLGLGLAVYAVGALLAVAHSREMLER
jgi:putative copper export protein